MKKFGLGLAILVTALFPLQAQELPSLDSLINDYYAAMGGLSAWQEKQTCKITAAANNRGYAYSLTSYRKRPDWFRSESIVHGGVFIDAYDGEEAWMINSAAGITEPVVKPVGESVTGQPFEDELLNWQKKGHQLQVIGRDTIDTKPVIQLLLTRRKEAPVHYFLDQETHLPVMTREWIAAVEKHLDTYFSDYRQVDGVVVPFRTSQKIGDEPYIEMTLKTVAFNVPLDNALFSRTSKGKP